MKTSLLLVSIGLLLNANAFKFMGVNQAGAEFGTNIPGTYMVDYTFPRTSSIDYFIQNGMNIIRLPFLWERLQPQLNGAFDSAYLSNINATVQYVTVTKGVYVLLDVHNYLLYNNVQIGAGVDYSAFENFWKQLAGLYKSNPKVIFGLMNEPHDAPYTNVYQAMQAGINGIRASGATNAITVPGNDWTGAHSWMNSAPYMNGTIDPLNNFMFEMHQYFDENFSGNGACVSTFDPETIFGPATAWLRAVGRTGFLGEFGIEKTPQCLTVLANTMAYLQANSDVWVGWTWWAAGPWWGSSYKLSLEQGVGDAQFAVLKQYMTASSVSTPTPTVQTPSTTGYNIPSTTASAPTPAAPATTGRVKQSQSTTGSAKPSTTGASYKDNGESNDAPVPSSNNCTSGNMKCLSGDSYSTCNWGVWGGVQKCVTGTYCSPKGNYIYCLSGQAPASTSSSGTSSSTSSSSTPSSSSSTSAKAPAPVPVASTSSAPTQSSDSCSLGQLRCSATNQYQTCGYGQNGGFQWSAPQQCQSGLSCHSFGDQVYCY
jgi:endoglucanase